MALNKDEREYLRLDSDINKATSEIYRNRAQALNIKADTQLKGVEKKKALQQVRYYEALADFTGGKSQEQYMRNVLYKYGIHDKNSTKWQRAAILIAEEMSGAKFDNKMHITNGKEIGERIEKAVSKIAKGLTGEKAVRQQKAFRKFYDSMNNRKQVQGNVKVPKVYHPKYPAYLKRR